MRRINLITAMLYFALSLTLGCDIKGKQEQIRVDTITVIARDIPESETIVIEQRIIPVTEHFGYPLGYPDFEGYFDAKPFGNFHLGADFNGNEGGDSDWGDTIKSIGNGVVTYSSGALLNIMHRTTDNNIPVITAIYYHCDTLFVQEGDMVEAGQPIALLGKKDTNVAHLHFEIATDTTQVGGFYGDDASGFMNPVIFLDNHK